MPSYTYTYWSNLFYRYAIPDEYKNVVERTINCLTDANILTVIDLQAMSDRELLRLLNFGPKSLKLVRMTVAPAISTHKDKIVIIEKHLKIALELLENLRAET